MKTEKTASMVGIIYKLSLGLLKEARMAGGNKRRKLRGSTFPSDRVSGGWGIDEDTGEEEVS